MLPVSGRNIYLLVCTRKIFEVNQKAIIGLTQASIVILCCFLLTNCGTSRGLKSEESFDIFYQKFHLDSLFQISRLQDPMQGVVIEGKSISKWGNRLWVMHKAGKGTLDPNIFKVEQERVGNRIIERIYEPGSVLYNERHFELKNGQWFLIYYLNFLLS